MQYSMSEDAPTFECFLCKAIVRLPNSDREHYNEREQIEVRHGSPRIFLLICCDRLDIDGEQLALKTYNERC